MAKQDKNKTYKVSENQTKTTVAYSMTSACPICEFQESKV